MAFLRALLFTAAFAGFFVLIAALQDYFTRRHPAVARWVSIAFCRSLLRLLRITVEIRGAPAEGGPVLLVANHISWIDILALGSVMPFCFLAKSEVAAWPLLAKFATVQGTVFVDRARKRCILDANRALAERMLAGRKALLFPEGTTYDGSVPGRFLSSHFAAARDLLRLAPELGRVAVQPIALVYSSPVAPWLGAEALVPHLWRVLRSTPFRCTVSFGSAIPYVPASNRKVVALAAREAVLTLLTAIRAGVVAGTRATQPRPADQRSGA